MTYDSRSIDALKTVKEQLPENYTTGQLLQVLDSLLIRAVTPIIENTTYMDTIISVTMSWYTDNPRRKISVIGRDKTFSLMFLYLTARSTKAKIKILVQLRLERNILFSAIYLFLKQASPYRDLVIQKIKEIDLLKKSRLESQLSDIKNALGASDNLYPSLSSISFWVNQAVNFKNMLIEKYMRHIFNKARLFQIQSNYSVDLEDLVQNFVLATSKAIDKVDADQGTLTSYIDHWLKNACYNSSFKHEYGIAYNIPQSFKVKIAKGECPDYNLAITLSDESLSNIAHTDTDGEFLDKTEEQKLVRRLAKAADPWGFARIHLNLSEVVID